MTNADKIRAMTDEELAELMNSSLDYFNCNDCEYREHVRNGYCNENGCTKYILKWLKDEAI